MQLVLKRLINRLLLFVMVISVSSCAVFNSTENNNFEQQRFETPQDLVAALKSAASSKDSAALLKILGPDGRNLLFSGDPVLDNLELELLSQRLTERAELIPYKSSEFDQLSVMKLRLGKMGVNAGIPLVNEGKGWRLASRYFAPRSVKRRIASNEIQVWRACMEYVEAQRQYVKYDRNGDGVLEFAQKLISTPGQHNGLFWKTPAGAPQSPLGEVVAQANAIGYTEGTGGASKPFFGYIFKVLTQQGNAAREGKRDYIVDGKMTKGFALVAYPIEWGASGVRTFVVGPDGNIYGKNLGVSTEQIASQMEAYNPDRSWQWVEQPQINEFEQYLETL
jgi:hypothetical protein